MENDLIYGIKFIKNYLNKMFIPSKETANKTP